MVSADEGRLIAQLIDTARRNHRPKLSVRAAAARAGISEGWWRQLAAGYQRRGETDIAVVGSPETYLAMAAVVGVESEARRLLGEEAPDVIERPAQEISGVDGFENDEVVEAILRTDSLIDETRQHLITQYALLRRLSPPAQLSERRSSHRPGTPAGDAQLRAVARGGDPADRAEVRRIARQAREQYEQEEDGETDA